MFSSSVAGTPQQQAGSIRGIVRDKEFEAPLAAAQVTAVETGQKVVTTDQGNFIFAQIPPGKYTLVFTKEGYVRQVKAEVLVSDGQLTDVDVSLSGEFTEMDEFVAQDLLHAGLGSESALLNLRFKSPSLMDSIGSDLIARAGVSDAAGALRLVAGASVAANKSAVIRGLPDRYVSSQMNGVVLPSADSDKRAVQLDQFPSTVIESIQVSKTFTPDQQGDASGGAVNIRLKSIPDEGILQFKGQLGYNSQVTGIDNFLTYEGGGVNQWGFDNGQRDIQFNDPPNSPGHNWTGAVGTSTAGAPRDYKWAFTAGDKLEIADGVKLGGLASFFYERYSSYYNDGQDNSYWVETPGGPMVPQHKQPNGADDFKTALYDVTQGKQGVRWGGLGTLGLQSENNVLGLTYLYTHTAEDTATLSTDTRGKAYFFPGYDPHDPMGLGNSAAFRNTAPYLRLETLDYTERTTGTLQFNGWHRLPLDGFNFGDLFQFRPPELDWIAAFSSADLNQPDKRQFGAYWVARSYHTGTPPFQPPGYDPSYWFAYKPSDNSAFGNVQHIYKDVNEESQQYAVNLTLPFRQWSEADGYMKVGFYDNDVDRTFTQNTFSNFNDPSLSTPFNGPWSSPWSEVFPSQNHPITASPYDVDYDGHETVSAWYGMMDLPLSLSLNLIGGARVESTSISIVNFPGPQALWFKPGAGQLVDLHPGEADVDFQQSNVLPSIGLVYKPVEPVTLRASYGQTVARQTFKELSPILSQDYLGGPAFVGNPFLGMATLKNYDLRADYVPLEGTLLSSSYFYKAVKNPIEYVQSEVNNFDFTTPVNYPKGNLNGIELEFRQSLGVVTSALDGLAVGANATFINSEVTLPADEAASFSAPGIKAPMSTRNMTNAPDHLYNLYLTYDIALTSTQFAVFYTVQGDTLIAGATQTGALFVPNVYALQFDTLNVSVSQNLWKNFNLQFQAKNLTNPNIETVYRSKYIGPDVLKTTYSRGVELSLALTATFGF